MKSRLMALFLLLCLLPGLGLAGEVEAEKPQAPIPGSRPAGRPDSFWETPMDISDTDAVWRMLTAPITVVEGHQKQQTVLRAEPRDDAAAVADLTYASQGIHVLEKLDSGWSLVEIYSSSFHDSKIKAWNQLVQGYVRTELLKEKKVNQRYGLVVDKLSQRLYIFMDGKLFDTLYISTGLPNERQPYNETRSGEFLIVSPVGDFKSDNIIGAMALRFNDGDFIHEVPYIKRGSTKSYDPMEGKLGSRASHGCIRVQRKRTPQGTNMRWLWDNLRKNMGVRIVIWEDVAGRQLPLPDPGTKLYYNAKGGKDYHAAPKCYGVRDKFYPLEEFTYGQLEEGNHAALTPCAYCVPPLRVKEIEAINVRYSAPVK